MTFYIKVIAPDGMVLFGGSTRDVQELEAVAAEARRLRPTARILLRHPMGEVVEFDPQD
jgi:hypothetical protein